MCFSAVFFRQHAFGDQLLLDAVGICLGLIDFVDGHDDRHLAGLGVSDCLLGLRHHSVVGRNDEHYDIGNLCAARAHCRERLMTGSIEEGDNALGCLDMISADVLRDAAGLAAGNTGAADSIEQ